MTNGFLRSINCTSVVFSLIAKVMISSACYLLQFSKFPILSCINCLMINSICTPAICTNWQPQPFPTIKSTVSCCILLRFLSLSNNCVLSPSVLSHCFEQVEQAAALLVRFLVSKKAKYGRASAKQINKHNTYYQILDATCLYTKRVKSRSMLHKDSRQRHQSTGKQASELN